MKAFKIFEIDSMNTLGFVVANDIDHADSVINDYCNKMEDDTLNDGAGIIEMTREEFMAMKIYDDQNLDDEGAPTLSEMDYDEEVANVTEAYVIEFDHDN